MYIKLDSNCVYYKPALFILSHQPISLLLLKCPDKVVNSLSFRWLWLNKNKKSKLLKTNFNHMCTQKLGN